MAATGLAEFFMGAVGGAAQAGVDSIVEKEKAEIERQRQEQLSRLRMQEHASNKAKDMELADAQAAKTRAREAEFYKRAEQDAPKGKPAATYTDTIGDEVSGADAGSETRPATEATRREREEYLAKRAMLEGESGLAERHIKGQAEARRDEEEARKTKAAEDANTLKQRELAQKEKRDSERTEIESRRVNALIARVAGGGASAKETAEIQNLRFYADNVFGGAKLDKDSEDYRAKLTEAAMWLRNHGDKPRDQRITEIANQLKDDPEYMGKSYEERLAAAGNIADRLRAGNTHTRGGVSPAPAPVVAPTAPKKDRPPLSSFERK